MAASWTMFFIHKKAEFLRNIMPRYFHQTKLTSFQRQLNLYGFARLTGGLDRGGYYHELFLRGRPELIHRIHRQKIKGHGCRLASSPGTEPNFYAMQVSYDPTIPTCLSGSNTEQENQVSAIIDATNADIQNTKGSKVTMEVTPIKEETAHDADRPTLDEVGVSCLMTNVSVELMTVGDDVKDNNIVILMDLDDQIDKESLAQVECDMALYDEAHRTTRRIDAIAGPVIVTPRPQHGPHSVLTLPDNGPQRWSIPLLTKDPISLWTTTPNEGTCVLKPFAMLSSATATSSMCSIDNGASIRQHRQQDGAMDTGDCVAVELRDGDEVWFDESHCFRFVEPLKRPRLEAEPQLRGHSVFRSRLDEINIHGSSK